jgi:hypothetical protein
VAWAPKGLGRPAGPCQDRAPLGRGQVAVGGPSVIGVAVSVGLPPANTKTCPWRPSPVSMCRQGWRARQTQTPPGRPSSLCRSPPSTMTPI